MIASRSVGMRGDELLQARLGLVGAIERVEIERHLDLRIALQRRGQRHPLVGLDREFGLLHRLVEVGERQQRQRMRRREIERELQIDEAEILAAAAAERGAEPVEHFGGARLRGVDQERQLLAGLEVADRLGDQRMARQRLVEGREDLERLVLVADRATDSCRRPAPRAAPSGRACRRARGACRPPCAGRRDRGSGRHAGP